MRNGLEVGGCHDLPQWNVAQSTETDWHRWALTNEPVRIDRDFPGKTAVETLKAKELPGIGRHEGTLRHKAAIFCALPNAIGHDKFPARKEQSRYLLGNLFRARPKDNDSTHLEPQPLCGFPPAPDRKR